MTDDAYNEAAARAAQEGAARGMAEDGQPQEELFPNGYIDGGKTTLKNLVKPAQGHKTRVKLSGVEVPLRGGLPDPDRQVRAMVTGIFQKESTLAERDDAANAMKVTAWKTTVHLRADYVEHVPDTDEGLIEQRFKAMLEVDARSAGALLEKLQVMASEQLALA